MTLVASAAFASSAIGQTNLVKNGDFQNFSAGAVNQWYYDGARLADWDLTPTVEANGSNGTQGVVFSPGAADHGGAEFYPGQHNGLYGPGNGWANGLTATSPAGGNYFGADDPVAAHQTLSQTINGLEIGKNYDLLFYWAAGQVTDFNGPTQNQITVGLGQEQYILPQVSIADHGFSGWFTEVLNFTPTNSSELLSFAFASPQPNGFPPIALLGGVSLSAAPAAVPEPATWALMLIGFGLIGFAARYRQKINLLVA